MTSPPASRDDVNPSLSLLGIVWAVVSALTVLAGLFVILMAAGFGGLVAVAPYDGTGVESPGWWPGVLIGGVGLAIGGSIALLGALGIAVGLALRRGRYWAMICALVLGILQLSNFPLGTALALWTFVVVGQELSRPGGGRAG